MTVLGPLFFVGQTLELWQEYEATLSSFPALGRILFVAILAEGALRFYGLLVGIAILGGEPNGRSLAKRYLLINLVGTIAAAALTGMQLNALSPQLLLELGGGLAQRVLGASVFSLVWWIYFKTSRRVKATYAD
ncbi:MAG: hypothetical protein ACOY3Y_20865 [Acidobacteriota bacterium]